MPRLDRPMLLALILGVLPAAAEDRPADNVAPFDTFKSGRERPRGEWEPTVLPPNDLTDPPVRYPNCEGGACIGMSAVTFGLWASPRSEETLTVDETAARFVHNLVPVGYGDRNVREDRFQNFPLPSKVVVDGETHDLADRAALVPVATSIQKRLFPGGGGEKTPEQVRAAFEEAKRLPFRIETAGDLRRELEKNGGRLVAVGLDFDPNVTKTSAHAFVLTMDEKGRVFVWDPNAEMAADALGSGTPSTLRGTTLPDGRLRTVVYDVELPEGAKQTRSFRFLYPIKTFLAPNRLPPRPR